MWTEPRAALRNYSARQCCRTGTVGTVTFWLAEPEPELVKKSEPEPELDIKLCIWFPSFKIFFIHIYNKLDKTYKKFSLQKSLLCKKARFFRQKFSGKFAFFWSRSQSKELGRGPSGIVSTFWRKVSLCGLQRSKEAVQITIILTVEWFVLSCRTSLCLFIIKEYE